MDATISTLDTIYEQADRLSDTDKLRLISKLAEGMHRNAKSVNQPETTDASIEADNKASEPRPTLRGAWAGIHISDEDIEEARREMWGNFPREDI